MPPEAAVAYRRTPAEVADAVLAWQRPDRAVFAAGACHVLAFRGVERWPHLGVRWLRPTGSEWGHHVVATDGTVAVDFNGWSSWADLWRVHAEACRSRDGGWRGQVIEVRVGLEEFCRQSGHRAPASFPGDVVARAERYLDGVGLVTGSS